MLVIDYLDRFDCYYWKIAKSQSRKIANLEINPNRLDSAREEGSFKCGNKVRNEKKKK